MEKTFTKDVDGKVKVVETVVNEKVVDLHDLKEKKAVLEEKIQGRRSLYDQQAAHDLAMLGKANDAMISGWQAELDIINVEIVGAETAGVVEVVPVAEEVVADPAIPADIQP